MILRIIYATIATYFFGYLANINKKFITFAAISGLISVSIYELSLYFNLNIYLATFLAAISFSVYAEIMARLIKTTASTFAISGLLPLAPGATMYNAMNAFVNNNIYQGQILSLSAIFTALILTLGILLTGSFVQLFKNKALKK